MPCFWGLQDGKRTGRLKMSADIFSKLGELGAQEVQHLNGSLLSHLQGVQTLLAQWGNREALCTAGLYHAVYGTIAFDNPLIALQNRPAIAALIGQEAEQIAYHFGACDRDKFYPQIGTAEAILFPNRFAGANEKIAPQMLNDILELVLANELEIVSNDPDFLEQHRAWFVELFERLAPFVSDAGFQTYRQIFASKV